ncbi:ABC transporter substrate-binding protein [Rhodospirillum rubrum]|uniref:Branched-chain amino acid transport system substrate-binding protein n=1 Tax=Rhodospirillum rubrum (strain ATCC 11170 / ATH 1.1.1 / DSM 467 / LMG 4362 / NCIMB 8255 / S1) TaxID=269796 RepID=Q2RNJ5_RHORT|nr:ABC transporter substrate-binding protein [Rhodospirillum rubrum]ABC24300.1 putative branched-chain amino acid transport system substrate-binding protein [Rhodospirillum rubrum ATCC 11170]AEO50051.1 putative branched-chain amino acid ABC transport system substrate-binding protein [Rhodospirillum rubrum F11]MBK5956019.1 branched-chain amino acid ABC transporter substrate-binding protein [Rhodospirillum rubrum]QXG80227.1 ABC transporter substrate-binding protein [Rhodospirillum rubrum]HAP9957
MKTVLSATLAGALLAMLSPFGGAQADDSVFVGHLKDVTGATGFVGKLYGEGVNDALVWINAHGGIDGTRLDFESVDYAYEVPRAIALYKKWTSQNKMVALQGWGTGDTEALISFVAKDKIPVLSGSYSGHLTDPTGKNPKTQKPAPYNFFYGPSYSDACRALVQWAEGDWKAKGKEGKPKFIHAGDNHPYPNAPKEACADFATELGFEVLPPVVVSLKPGDFKAQCLTIKQSGANYVYVANLGPSVVSLVKSCKTVGTDAQYMANIWGGDSETQKTLGADGDGYVFVAANAFWGDDAPGLALVREIAGSETPRTHHYIRGVCSTFYMKEAMEWAKAHGGLTGESIRNAMYARKDWVPKGLEGVCIPSTWTPEDHRGMTKVFIYQMQNGSEIHKIAETDLPRRDDWLGY